MIIYLISGLVLAICLFIIFNLSAKNKTLKIISEQKLINNKALLDEREYLEKNNIEKLQQIDCLQYQIDDLNKDKNTLDNIVTNKKNELKNTLDDLEDDARTEHGIILKELTEKFISLSEATKNAQQAFSKMSEEIEIASKLRKEFEEKENRTIFHTLQLTEDELFDINKLRTLAKEIKQKEVLNKVIWKSYFEKSTTDLINRLLVPKSAACGIYMLKDLISEKIYIGQSVNIAERFKQHIKRGLGAETGSMNRLYSAMKEHGVENFAFYIIQLCPREELSRNEKNWIDFYKSNIYGLNSNSGG